MSNDKGNPNSEILGAPASLPARSAFPQTAGRDAGAPRFVIRHSDFSCNLPPPFLQKWVERDMDTLRICPSCGKPLAADAPQGICPECLMKAGFVTAPGPESSGRPGFVPPTIETITK